MRKRVSYGSVVFVISVEAAVPNSAEPDAERTPLGSSRE
jgi:hypothetical protein